MRVLGKNEEGMVTRDRHSKGAASFRFISVIAALGILSGCVTSYVGNPEIVKQNNAKLTKYDQGTLSDPDEASRDDQLRRLWREKPEYVALIGAKHAKTIRIVSIAAPKYPYWEAWAKKRAEVVLQKLRMGHRCGCKLGGFPDLQFDPKSCRGRHVDERIEAKQIDLTAQ